MDPAHSQGPAASVRAVGGKGVLPQTPGRPTGQATPVEFTGQ